MKLKSSVLRNIDKKIRPLIKILNEKNYLTFDSCEGHREEWILSVGFVAPYEFPIYPPRAILHNGRFYHWEGKGDAEKDALIAELMEWASNLPQRELILEYNYTLLGRDKKGNWRTLYSNKDKDNVDFEEIKKKKKKVGYTEFKEFERLVKMV